MLAGRSILMIHTYQGGETEKQHRRKSDFNGCRNPSARFLFNHVVAVSQAQVGHRMDNRPLVTL